MVTNIGPNEMQKQMAQFKSWINTQSDLPNLEDKLLIKFLHSCYYDLEKSKKAYELFFNLRSSAPEVLNNRDPLSPAIQKAFKLVNLALYKICGNRNLWIWQCNDPGLQNYEYVQDVKLFFLKTDAWLLEDLDLEESDIAIFDVNLLTLKFITKFNVFVARKLAKYQQIHFHTPKSDTLYQHFNRDELPEDFGGTRGTMTEHMENLVALITSKREYFLDDYSLWRKDKNSNNKTEITSFRSLDID